nr:immunoglobulin heavy chain junction region [Macaca mulatta]
CARDSYGSGLDYC